MDSTPSGDIPAVSREELIGRLRSGPIIVVDVLSPESFAARHIPGAINLPVEDIAGRSGAILPDRHAPLVIYCGGPT